MLHSLVGSIIVGEEFFFFFLIQFIISEFDCNDCNENLVETLLFRQELKPGAFRLSQMQ
jgi:hypothetical protein